MPIPQHRVDLEELTRSPAPAIVFGSGADGRLLVKIEKDAHVDLSVLSRRHKADIQKLDSGVDELLSKNLVRKDGAGYAVTPDGCDVLNLLATARRKNLTEIINEWSPEQREEIANALQRLARELVPDVQPKAQHGI